MTTDPDARHRQIREEVRRLAAGGFLPREMSRQGVTSDLSIDETLILHSIGWEAVDLVCGASAFSIPVGFWQWGNGEIEPASLAHQRSVGHAAKKILKECQRVGGRGVVGVDLDITVERNWINTVLVGTAVSPIGKPAQPPPQFVSDLSARDFALLHQAGWDAVGLAHGAAFVYAPRRNPMKTVTQSTRNVELTNYTEALYGARESAMERMQSSALECHADGVVGVQVVEGPVEFAKHAIAFTAWGTAIRLSRREARPTVPSVVLSIDDRLTLFRAEALRGD